MPEAAVDKDGHSCSREDDVDRSVYVSEHVSLHTVPEPPSMQCGAERHLRPGSLLPHGLHPRPDRRGRRLGRVAIRHSGSLGRYLRPRHVAAVFSAYEDDRGLGSPKSAATVRRTLVKVSRPTHQTM